MNSVDNYRLKLGASEYVPIMLGGMGVDISTSEMVLETARLGGIGHLSDAMIPAVCDKNFGEHYVRNKVLRYNQLQDESFDEHRIALFDLTELRQSQLQYVGNTINKKRGNGAVFINCMEKVTMGSPEMLAVRMIAAMDAGIDGITLSAGLHGYSLRVIENHPRFRDVKIGIVVSSWRALKIFLRTASRVNRLPDFVVVEGPLAGGHLGFGPDEWQQRNLMEIFLEIQQNLKSEDLNIPLIPGGGIFNATEALPFFEQGAAAIQVATRFTITQESGLPPQTRDTYINAEPKDVVVTTASPTGYPMRILASSPSLHSNVKPQCVPLGFALDSKGWCSYQDAYRNTENTSTGEKLQVKEKMCLCFHIGRYHCWTCGSTVVRLKETVKKVENGSYLYPTTEQVFLDYQNGEDRRS